MVYSFRAFTGSPIQISSTLEKLDDFELSLYCNEEIIAINQDSSFSPAKPYTKLEGDNRQVHVYKRKLSDGGYAIGIFNVGETREIPEIYLDNVSKIRDVWAKKDMANNDIIRVALEPHTVRIFKINEI